MDELSREGLNAEYKKPTVNEGKNPQAEHLKNGANKQLSYLLVVCAYNEERHVSRLLNSVKAIKDFLIVDDGSTDATCSIALQNAICVLSHKRRMGKQLSLKDAINVAVQNNYDVIIEADADARFDQTIIKKILSCLEEESIGAVTVRQVPVGKGFSWFVEKIFWDTLAEAKLLQMRRFGSCYLGGVMYGFKTSCFKEYKFKGYLINDDEELDEIIRLSGLKTIFLPDVLVSFDSSVSMKHLLLRRIRMVLGHHLKNNSNAPSMSRSVTIESMLRAIVRDPRLLPFSVPAVLIELTSHFFAFLLRKDNRMINKYMLWPRPSS